MYRHLAALNHAGCPYDTKTWFETTTTPAARVPCPIRDAVYDVSRLPSVFVIRGKINFPITPASIRPVLCIMAPLMQGNGNKAPCYPANTVIAPFCS